jgi:hypothetical protein
VRDQVFNYVGHLPVPRRSFEEASGLGHQASGSRSEV